MKWVLIIALWNTPVPQDSFKFYTETFSSEASCQEKLQYLYAKSFDRGIHAQAICVSEEQLDLLRPSY